MLHTYIRRALAIALLPALIFVSTTPAPAQFADWAIVANQVTQIGQAVTMIARLREQKEELTRQYTLLRGETLGILGPFDGALSRYVPTAGRLLNTTVSWGNDFLSPRTGEFVSVLTGSSHAAADQLIDYWRTRLADADTVADPEITALFSDGNPDLATAATEALRLQRDRAEQQLAGDYATLQAAEGLAENTAEAQQKLAQLRTSLQDPTLGAPALQRAHLAGLLANSEVQLASAQVLTYSTIRDNITRQQRELERRTLLARWTQAERAAQALAAEETAYLAANAPQIDTAMLMTSYLGPIE